MSRIFIGKGVASSATCALFIVLLLSSVFPFFSSSSIETLISDYPSLLVAFTLKRRTRALGARTAIIMLFVDK